MEEFITKSVSRSRSRDKADGKQAKRSTSVSSDESVHFSYNIGDPLGTYQITGHLGDGTFGRVLEVINTQQPDTKYAVKVIKMVRRYVKSAQIEIKMITDLNRLCLLSSHTRIVQYMHTFTHQGRLCMVFERLGLSLYQSLKTNDYQPMSLSQVKWIAQQSLEGLSFMHSQGIIHTDLKPENILFTVNANAVKIIDLGGATYLTDNREGIINTRQYRSPEVTLDCEDWTVKSDIWSLACILIEIATGKQFFSTHSEKQHLFMIERMIAKLPYHMVRTSPRLARLFEIQGQKNYGFKRQMISRNKEREAKDQKRLDETFDLTDPEYKQFYKLLKDMLRVDPDKRLSCTQALEHSFFNPQIQR